MTKNILLAATALSAIALAGAANAQVITGGNVNAAPVAAGAFGAPTSTPYLIASEMKNTVPANLSTSAATNSTSTLGQGIDVPTSGTSISTLRLNLTLGGTATQTFQSAVLVGDLTAGGHTGTVTTIGNLDNDAVCEMTAPVLAAGGAIGTNSVAFEFSADAGCETTGALLLAYTTFAVNHSLSIAQAGTVTVTHALTRTGGETPLNLTADALIGTAVNRAARTFVSSQTGYAFTITPDATDTFLALETSGNQFRTISGGNAIGTVNLTAAAGVFANLAGNAIPSTDYNVTLVSLDGVFSATAGLNPAITAGCNPTGTASTAFTLSGNTATTNTCIAGAARTISINAAPGTGNTASLANRNQRYSVTLTPASLDGTAARVNQPAAQSGLLETIEIAGQRITAPWVTDTTRGFNTVLRLANTAGNAIGAIQLQLSSPAVASANATRVCDASTVAGVTTRLSGIAANSVVTIDSGLLEQCFGQFRNGDLSVTVLDNANNVAGLSAKLRLVAADGSVSEQTLGRSSGTAGLQ